MNAMGVLAAWHCFGWWLAMCTLMCNAMQLLLKGFVDWLARSTWDGRVHYDDTCFYFFAIFVRSWLLVCFYSDLIRHCAWLCRDAWRPDSFEAYRRTVCGLGVPAMRNGSLYDPECAWPPAAELRGWVRRLDILLQVLIYASMDVAPLALAGYALLRNGIGQGALKGVVQGVCTIATKTLAMAALCHALLFWLCWLLTDVAVKVSSFSAARQGLDFAGLVGQLPCNADCEGQYSIDNADYVLEGEVQLDAECDRMETPWTRSPSKVIEASTRTEQRLRSWRPPWNRSAEEEQGGEPSTADAQNICVALCNHSRFFLRNALWIVMFLSALAVGEPALCILACFMAVFTFSWYADEGRVPHCEWRPWWWHSSTEQVWALQEWGEQCCGLDPEVQFERRKTFAILAIWEAVIFTSMGWYRYTLVFVVLLSAQLKFVVLRDEAPWGWLLGLLESAFSVLVMLSVCLWNFCPSQPSYAVNAILMVLAHQGGLASKGYNDRAGYRIYRAVMFILFGLLWAVVTLVCYTMLHAQAVHDRTRDAGGFYTLCDPKNPNCSYVAVPNSHSASQAGLPCREWISLGGLWEGGSTVFSLSDLALFAALAYEEKQLVGEALQHYFPGWRLTYAHLQRTSRQLASGTEDWTNFFDFVSPDNRTTIVAVRGTRNPVDALTDLIIWMPAVIIQFFSLVGPNMLPAAEQTIADFTHVLSVQAISYHEVYKFDTLYRHVVSLVKRNPGTEFLIVGHSLGGGLAKIVSERALREGLSIQAVTFMSPGLAATGYLLLDPFRTDWVDLGLSGRRFPTHRHAQTLTVMPDQDVVSRIDEQTGLVVPIPCTAGDALTCHLLFTGICEMLKECGSGREQDGSPLLMPCGKCPEMPCPGR